MHIYHSNLETKGDQMVKLLEWDEGDGGDEPIKIELYFQAQHPLPQTTLFPLMTKPARWPGHWQWGCLTGWPEHW